MFYLILALWLDLMLGTVLRLVTLLLAKLDRLCLWELLPMHPPIYMHIVPIRSTKAAQTSNR